MRVANIFFWLALTVFAVICGASIVIAPLLSWAIFGGLLALLLLNSPPYYWALATFLFATLSRPIAAFGLAPGSINFFHFPLALGAAAVALLRRQHPDRLSRQIGTGVICLLAVSFFSWAANGGEPLRPVFTWLVFCEPLLVLYAILRSDLTPGMRRAGWAAMLGIALLQFPVGIWQALTVGISDDLQGTFMGQGAGAHVAGSVCMLGVLICAARGATASRVRNKISWFICALILFSIPLLADANQVIIAGAAGLLVTVITSIGINPFRLLVPTAFVLVLLYAGYSLYTPLQRIARTDLLSDGLAGKVGGIRIVLTAMERSPAYGVLGLGPGNSVSRVALLTSGADIKDDSPVAVLRFQTAPVTADVLKLTESNYVWRSSSVWSAVSSWLGLLGDLGLFGIALYLGMVSRVWRALPRRCDWRAGAAKGAFAMAALLAAIYSWLEEPAFTIMIAFISGLAVDSATPEFRVFCETSIPIPRSGDRNRKSRSIRRLTASSAPRELHGATRSSP